MGARIKTFWFQLVWGLCAGVQQTINFCHLLGVQYLSECMLSHFSHALLFATLWTIAHLAPLTMGFFSQECWSRLSLLPSGDLPDPGIKSASPVLQADSLPSQTVKNLPAMQETQVCSLGWEDPLEMEMTTHSSILAWRIPWTEKPGRLHSMGLQRVGHDSATNTISSLRAPDPSLLGGPRTSYQPA